MSLPAPFPPLVSGGDGLDRYPAAPAALAMRLGQIYGVPAERVLPVRGVTHGLELVWRLAARDGGSVQAPDAEPYSQMAAIYGSGAGQHGEPATVVVGALGSVEAAAEMAARTAPALLVIDEGLIEFAPFESAASLAADHPNLIVLRSLSLAYGLAGVRVGAAVAAPETLARLASVREPYALPAPLVRLAMQALDPSRMIETAQRIEAVKAERARLVRALERVVAVEPGFGPVVVVGPDVGAAHAALDAYGIDSAPAGERLRLPVSARPEVNDRLLAAFGLTPPGARAARRGEAVRDTRETRIACAVDLDASGPVSIETGIGFFDHMIEQIAAHGGFSIRLSCAGDLHIDPHHTIEDSAIALGQALKQALGERRGIGRYGFVLPMDEAEAKVSIDLSGRPYSVFDGTFATPFIGEYRTDLTAHVFRSLAEHLGAAIHVSVTGEDDHHMTEACFKALGRALRQAVRVEGDVVPSTKGVL